MCVCVDMLLQCTYGGENNCLELTVSFHYVVSGDETQVLKFGSKSLQAKPSHQHGQPSLNLALASPSGLD